MTTDFKKNFRRSFVFILSAICLQVLASLGTMVCLGEEDIIFPNDPSGLSGVAFLYLILPGALILLCWRAVMAYFFRYRVRSVLPPIALFLIFLPEWDFPHNALFAGILGCLLIFWMLFDDIITLRNRPQKGKNLSLYIGIAICLAALINLTIVAGEIPWDTLITRWFR